MEWLIILYEQSEFKTLELFQEIIVIESPRVKCNVMLYCVFYEFKKVFLRYTLSYFALLVYILTIGKHVLFARFFVKFIIVVYHYYCYDYVSGIIWICTHLIKMTNKIDVQQDCKTDFSLWNNMFDW